MMARQRCGAGGSWVVISAEAGGRAVREDRGNELLRNLRLQTERDVWMITSLVLSLCAIMVVAVLVPPLFGLRVAALTAVATVLGIVSIC
jgi:hypothetical protein